MERVSWEVRRGLLVVYALLILGATAFAMGLQVTLPSLLETQWPSILIIGGGALLLLGLVTARAAGVLFGPLLVALGLTGILAEQEVLAASMPVVGGMLMLALAVGLALRGISFARRE
ncbi:MAG: hypothetical protein JXN59_04030 [Anaerolineae bacterium]|nr:hypothetical protein [Anaerolineae bacterium]